jgi:hypothetical protein
VLLGTGVAALLLFSGARRDPELLGLERRGPPAVKIPAQRRGL